MANKSRTQIMVQIKSYVPQANASTHDTLVDSLIDLAAEEISHKYNFTYLRATTPASHDVTANEYYIDESDFSFTNLKEILFLQWIKAATGESGEIEWLPYRDFQRKYPYVEYSGQTDGKPTYYTRYGNRLHFNCQLDETVSMRAWYQQLHGNFADDNAVHKFQPDNLGFQAIVACVLSELQHQMPGLKLNQKTLLAIQKKDYWINQLIEHDLKNSGELIELEPADKRTERGYITNPYDWV